MKESKIVRRSVLKGSSQIAKAIPARKHKKNKGPPVHLFALSSPQDFLKELDDVFPELAIYKQGRIQTSPGVEDRILGKTACVVFG